MQIINKNGKLKRVGNHRKKPIIIWDEWTDDRRRKGTFTDDIFGRVAFRNVNGENILQHVPTRHPEIPTAAQTENRQKIINITRFYSLLKTIIPSVWERPKKNPPKLDSDFIAQNRKVLEDDGQNIALTSLQNRAKACALTSFLVSNGTLSAISVEQGISSIRLPRHFTIDEQTTIAEFSAALMVSDGRGWREGDSLAYLSVRQHESPLEDEQIPHLTYIFGRVTLNIQDERPLYSVFPPEGAAVCHNRLAHRPPTVKPPHAATSLYGYCWIKTRIVKNNLHASPQRLILSDECLARLL